MSTTKLPRICWYKAGFHLTNSLVSHEFGLPNKGLRTVSNRRLKKYLKKRASS